MMKSRDVTESLMYKNSCLSMAIKREKGRRSYKTDVMSDEWKTIKEGIGSSLRAH